MLVTTCPECDTTFRVTAGILDQAGGQVRCGRCGCIFDANTTLREHPDAETRPIESPAETAGETSEETQVGTASGWYLTDAPPFDEYADETAAAESGHQERPMSAADAAAAAPGEPTEAQEREETTADTGAPTGPSTAAELAEDQDDAVIELSGEDETAETADVAGSAAAGDAAGEPEDTAEPDEADEADEAAAAGSAEAEDKADSDPATPDWLPPLAVPVRRRWPYVAGAAVLVLALSLQIVHRFRDELAGSPGLAGPLRAAYSALGLEPPMRIDLERFELRDLTAVAEPVTEEQGWLVIETRVQNTGPVVQPVPYIFVALLDRWQETIAGRYFSPEEYAVGNVGDFSRMPSGSTIDAQFVIVDPGPAATGFELQLCAPAGASFVCDGDALFE